MCGLLVPMLLLGRAGLADTATVTIDGSQTYQVIEGFGVNANHRSWNNNELQPVLDALIDQGGMTLFRVIFDKADWEATNDNSDPNVMNWDYYNQVYSAPDFQKMWDMSAYLNQKGITNGLMFNFQGSGPDWMGGSTLTPATKLSGRRWSLRCSSTRATRSTCSLTWSHPTTSRTFWSKGLI